MPKNQALTTRQFKQALHALRRDLQRLAAAMQQGFAQLNRRLNRLLAEEKRRYSVIELSGRKYRFYK